MRVFHCAYDNRLVSMPAYDGINYSGKIPLHLVEMFHCTIEQPHKECRRWREGMEQIEDGLHHLYYRCCAPSGCHAQQEPTRYTRVSKADKLSRRLAHALCEA